MPYFFFAYPAVSFYFSALTCCVLFFWLRMPCRAIFAYPTLLCHFFAYPAVPFFRLPYFAIFFCFTLLCHFISLQLQYW